MWTILKYKALPNELAQSLFQIVLKKTDANFPNFVLGVINAFPDTRVKRVHIPKNRPSQEE
jgi:hypothetical protein